MILGGDGPARVPPVRVPGGGIDAAQRLELDATRAGRARVARETRGRRGGNRAEGKAETSDADGSTERSRSWFSRKLVLTAGRVVAEAGPRGPTAGRAGNTRRGKRTTLLQHVGCSAPPWRLRGDSISRASRSDRATFFPRDIPSSTHDFGGRAEKNHEGCGDSSVFVGELSAFGRFDVCTLVLSFDKRSISEAILIKGVVPN